jgi:hypothetical protein
MTPSDLGKYDIRYMIAEYAFKHLCIYVHITCIPFLLIFQETRSYSYVSIDPMELR